MISYRPQHHISATSGWINDPNGFCYFKGQYHLFAQHNPHGLVWGPMHWLHFVSEDLVNFEEVGLALEPGLDYDRDFGCFSGSAVVLGDTLYLYYTGVNEGVQTQCVATSKDGFHFEKFAGNPVIDQKDLPEGYSTFDFRDPKVFQKDGGLYLLVSCRHDEGYSSVLLYKADDPFRFHFVGIVDSFEDLMARSKDAKGNPVPGVAECPDILFFGDEVALIVSLQFKAPQGNSFQNVHSVAYAFGKLDLETGKFTASTPYQELDHGFDVYATQTLQKDGKNYLVYWENMWDDATYPDTKEGYCGVLSAIRKVKRDGNVLKMGWIPEFKKNVAHGKLHLEALDEDNDLFLGKLVSIRLEPSHHRVLVSRINQDEEIRYLGGEIRSSRYVDVDLSKGLDLEYCIDRSCVELSFQDGMASFSMRIYGYSDSDRVEISSRGLEINKDSIAE
ncbi:MAG: glycoside hydrolase family 32 protein [Candidatus Enteromonas sp.]